MNNFEFKVLIFILLLVLPFNVSASSGALRKSSIKMCPDGNYYGYHGSNGSVHWHLARKDSDVSSGWIAIGEPLSGDPCYSSVTTTTKKITTTKSLTTTKRTTMSSTTNTTTTTTPTTTSEPTILETITEEVTTTNMILDDVSDDNDDYETESTLSDEDAENIGLGFLGIWIGGAVLAVVSGVLKKR